MVSHPTTPPRGKTKCTCPLSALPTGHKGQVMSVRGPKELRRRLLEMGFCKTVRVEVIRRAPLGDPIEFNLWGYHLSLRSEQAQFVDVLPDTPGCRCPHTH
jgi:ferrous iron transport protein A